MHGLVNYTILLQHLLHIKQILPLNIQLITLLINCVIYYLLTCAIKKRLNECFFFQRLFLIYYAANEILKT